MSKSANYCYAHLSDGTGLLLLCEVAAKPFYERTGAEYNADQGCKTANARYVPVPAIPSMDLAHRPMKCYEGSRPYPASRLARRR